MAHEVVEAAEKLLDVEQSVSNIGFVKLVDYLGSDKRIVESARISYGPGTKTFRRDSGLIHYLVENEHTSPLEQVTLVFHVKIPIFVARQWVRYRTAKLNEISGRYSVFEEEFFEPTVEEMCFQDEKNRQGSGEQIPSEEAEEMIAWMRESYQEAYRLYLRLIKGGLAREMARTVLPLSLYTQIYWKMDLHNLMRFIRQRIDHHAQRQIRDYTEKMALCAQAAAPIAYEAFEEHRLNTVTLSWTQAAALQALLDGEQLELDERNQRKFQEKLERIKHLHQLRQP